MSVQAKLILLRHGRTQYNKDGRMTGHHDVPLLPEGEEQAREAGRLLKDTPIAKVYSSPLSRAFNTAALALDNAGPRPELKDTDGSWKIEKRREIIEADAGDFTGRTKQDPEVGNWQWVYNIPMPNGESDKQVVARVQKLFDEELKPRLLRGENVLVVAHSGVLHAFDVVVGIDPVPADGVSRHKSRIPNASPLVCEYEDGVMKKHYFIENPKTTAANQNDPPPALRNKNAGPKP